MTRAICEQCRAAQPPDWQAGDLCVACGQTVRREKRCHWCTRLTPDGRFCRHCGSGLVADGWYGAARMLRAAGVDQFALPERLSGLDPAQQEHFSRLYAPQGQMLERHLEDREFAQGVLKRGDWTAALEDEVLPLLPLPEAQLKALTLPPAQQVSDLERLAEIRDGTPFAVTAHLAALARIRLKAVPEQLDAVRVAQALRSPDQRLADTAALTLADWRFTALPPFAVQPGELRDALHDLYRRTKAPDPAHADPAHAQAALGLALLAAQYANVQSEPIPADLLTPLLASEYSDLAFGAALVLAQTEHLLAALRVPERRFVAARALARQGHAGGLAPVLLQLAPYEQSEVLRQLRYGVGAVPELHAVLLRLLGVPEARNMAAELLLLEGRPEHALALIEADSSLAVKVLANPALSAAEVRQVCVCLLERGQFRLSRLSILGELADSGKIPDDFVPDMFVRAEASGQEELLGLAGRQLAARADGRLHRFLWKIIKGAWPEQTRERAWNVLAGWYGGYGAEVRFSLEGARHFFGGVEMLLERLSTLIERPELVGEFFGSYTLLNILQHPDDDILPSVREAGPVGERFRQALLSLALNEEAFGPHRAAAVRLLGQLVLGQLVLGQLARRGEERQSLAERLGGFLSTQDTHWEVQRAALAVLYPSLHEQQALMTELRAQLLSAQTYEQRSPLEGLIFQLERVNETG
jgi:hypothetical protein